MVGITSLAISTVLASLPGPSASPDGMRIGVGPCDVIASRPPAGYGSKNIASVSWMNGMSRKSIQ